MSPALSSRVYGRLIALYPDDLRRDYGAEMALTFADDLADAHREAGARGVIRVWRCALAEFVRLALPECASNPAVRVPAITFVFALACLLAAIAGRFAPIPLRVVCCGLVSDFSLPGVALLCVWCCRGSSVTSLNLSGDKPQEF